ncbi:nebulin isoform X38 [Oryx dammah]|uniref:nebulin isoform X38 n=1 Tax=Oryx dammah TaxID=59534 RepID=UPI001A9ADCD2|nr:nebulin isoform X38 [Oryx dammah]
MADDEEYEEVVEYYTEETVYEEVPGETITEFYETTTRTSDYEQSDTSRPALAKPVPEKPVERKRVIRKKVDPSKFMTPYIAHSQKMQDLFSTNKYKEKYEKAKGQPYAITTDTPELRRIKKVQDQLSEVKYRIDGDVAKTICHVDEKAKDIEHAKKVSQQVSKVLYKQNWEDTKDKYLLPPDAPELVQAIKNTAMFSKKLYTEDWEADKTLFYPYNDSPELRRVAQAQKALSDITYKKGLAEQQTQFTSLPDPPDIEFAKKVTNQVSKQKYKEDYENKVKGKWSETPCFEIATARMNSHNISTKKYQEDFENMKDQIYFMQTETPEYKVNKQAGVAASKVKYKQDYEKNKGKADYNVLPASENPLLRQLKAAGDALSDKLYKENYEKTKAKSINYCETPKFKLDTVLHNFSSDTKYKDSYLKNILGHYVGSYEDPYHTHCMKVSAQNSDKNYKAEYEEDRGKGFFPQTITQEYEAIKKLDQCKDHTYKVHPDKTKFTQVTDSPVLVQAQVNSKQLSDLNYKAKHENEKFKCHIPPDTPAFIQHKVNAYNLSDNIYKHDWEKTKAKKFDIKVDAIPLLAAKANTKITSDVMYKKDYEKSKGKMIGALSINDDPKMLHSLKTAKNQSDRLYKENYEKTKAKSMNYCETPKYQLDTLLKNFSEAKYKDSYVQNVLGHYIGSFEDPYQVHCMKVAAQNSDKNYKAEYEEDKGKCYFPQTITQEYEAIKKLDQCKDHTYKVHPDKTKFTAVTDTPVLLQAQLNTKQLSDLNYKAKHEGEKFKCHIPADAPQFIQHRVNAYNLSDNIYKHDWEKTKAKKFDIKVDAIPLLAAKANTKIASDVMYKKDYEKSKGKMIGALSINDDPKMLHSLKTAKNQSDREYRKDYEKSKTIYTAPLDMLPLTHAKKSQEIASNVDYKHLLHNYSYPPDSVNVDLAKKAYALQSDVDYKADYNSWMKGCGWVPFGSLEMEKAKRASDILNEKKYRQHPDTLKFTSIEDAPIIVQSKINQAQRSDVAYKAKGEEVIHKYSLPADLPQFIQAKVNAYNISENMYKADLKDLSKKGYDLRIDAIPIKAAKAARQAASDVQYKKDYEKAKGKMVGFQSLQDDPKLVHYMNVAKIQSDREYKKDYEKTKTKHNTPHDMVNIVAAKKAQDVASNVNYKHSLHHYTYLPDAMDLELSKNMMHIQSDNVYKEDYNNWMKGIGWIPIGSLEVEKVKKAGDALNEKKYRQHPDTLKFTSIVDSPVMVQAKQNTQQVSDILYKAKGEDVKHKYTMSPDLPQFLQAKCNAYNLSDVCYKRDWHDLIAKGTNVLGDAIPITAAKASRNIASDYKYKEAYEKAKGKQVGFRSLQDDPKLVHYMNVAKLQSDREYKKNYENTKTSYHTPGDMVSITAAKMAQDVATNVNYKQPIHHYTYLPDALSLEHIRNMNQIQSDNVYKDEYNHFFKGIGWIPIGSLEVEKVKKAGDALNEKKYRQHPDTIKFTSVPDSMGMVLAQHNTKQLSDLNYKVEGEKVKHKYTLDPDVPQFIQAKVNAFNMSDSHYKADWKKTLAKGYDLRPDAIPIVAAKSSRNIASDFKYKEAYEKAKGKQIGFRSLQDDPKLVHFMNVAKMQSDREYKKGYEASKTKYHTPLDMLSVTAAKKSQEVATNMNYKQPFHHYTLLPDALNVEHSRNAMQIQSDNLYKSDFTNWMKGIGWLPLESLEVEKAKKAGEILSEKKYRQHPEKLKFTYAMDTMEQALNKSNKLIMDKRLYTEKWNKDKTTIHVMPDTPDILLSRVNQITMSDKLYKAGWEEEKKKGYDLRPDAIPIKAARASRDIASDYKYKQAYEQTKGKQIGFRSLEDDPKLVHFMQVAKMQSDREYKKAYEKSKTSFHTPVDMLSVVAAKKSQEVATNANYRNVIHSYNMLPDAMSLELAKNMMQIQSDNQYKADYADFMKGVGWLPLGSLEAEKNKKAMEIISEKKYRQHPDTLKYSTLMDSMNMVLAKNNAKIMNEHLYKQAWEADKTKVHIMPDIPQIILAKANAINMSDKLYKLSLEEAKKKGYDLRTDAIPIKAAKASRDIASDYKYKHNYEKERGKMVGFRSLEDDPKLVHSMQVAKMQSDREYKKNYEKTKTSYHTPADMLSVTAAKDAQANITNTNYKHLIHKYILLPDAMNIQLSKNMNRLQSDNEYKQDYNEWYKGLGWSPAGSLEVEKAKRATEYASDQKYRQHPSNFQFSKLNDSMDMVLAKQNAHTMNKYLYTVDWNKDKTKIHVMPDTPDILQAKQNQTMYSQKLYKLGWEEALKKGYDLPVDAISVQAAKASRDIVSDFKYKQGYRKQIGHHIGFRSLQDDPKLVLSMNVAKMQSEREYKKDFEKWKTKFSSPVDMLGVVLAKKCQALVSDVDYKNYLHGWTCLPDQNDVIHAKKAYDLQSENLYKSDLEWLKGIGWSPLGSLEAEKNKRASEIISEKKYRQPPDRNKFTSIPDAMDIVLAKTNAKNRSDILYREAWDKDKTQVHIMPDTPDIILAKANLINASDKFYRMGYEELRKKGYDLPVDAIPIKAAKASREIASEYKYKEGFRKQLGHHIGARNIKDDPKMLWSMHVAKIQSDREYKKDFEKWKTKFSSPVDMLGVVLAKKCQTLVSDIDYKNYLHQWTCLPDQSDVIHARRAYDLQSDNLYKSDLQWLRGIGWLPSGSLEDEKNKRATQILSDHVYRQHPDKFKFSSLMDSIPMVLAKNNAITMNHRLYTEAWDKDKTTVHIMPDTPGVLLAKQNQINYSEKLYKLGLDEAKRKGYDMRIDAIPIRAAKASRDIASEFKYKEGYRRQLGHHIGARAIHDDPKMMWSMHVAKIQSDREYKKDFEKWKTKFSSPVDMLGVVLAKKCQTLVSDIDYKNYLHHWTCLPDQSDVIHARQAYDLQSDNVYKSDLQWLRGIGWVPIGSLDVEKCKRASEILSDKLYRQPPDKFKFTSVTDSLEQVLAKNNAINMNKRLYTEAWDKDKTQVHIMPDTPEITLARMNKVNYSESLYKLAHEEAKKKGYDLRSDAIPIVAAKASRDIISDYKYKDGYRKQLGHHIGARDIKDDPKMMWSMHVAKIQSDREYKKDFEKWKTKFSSPVDMLGVVLAKKCQTLVSDIDYKNYLHQWTCLPDQSDVIHARRAYDLQSDNVYKSDLQWLRGIGWVPLGSVDVVKCKRAAEILSDNLYRQPPDTLKFTSVPDSLEQVLAKNNAINMNKRLYTEAWDKDKTQIHIMPDTPEIMLARQNKLNYSETLYKLANEEAKKKGYDLRSDAIPIVAAKASRDIISDYKYKLDHEKQKGHYVGTRTARDDNKIRWALIAGKIQNEREYRLHWAKWKSKFQSPPDMLSIEHSKNSQTLVSDIDYRHYLHQWTCMPDQNDVIQARKAYDLQSDAIYKADLEWLRGIGWMPADSVSVNHAKHMADIFNEKKYRTKIETLSFTPVDDRVDYVTAKHSGEILNDIKYRKDWNDTKSKYTLTETPQLHTAQEAARILDQYLYKESWEKQKATGYILPPDAVPFVHAHHSGDVQSELKYKAEHVKQKGHYVGVPTMRDDPKLVWFEHAGQIQNDRLYKENYHKTKAKIHIPPDMVSVLAAKEGQDLASDIDYRTYLHQWICHPDQNDVIQARKAYDLQSDNIYKADLEWLRGIGWIPLDSVDHVRVTRNQEMVNQIKYKKDALANYPNFTSVVDPPEIVLAKINAVNQSDVKYKETFNKLIKGKYIFSPDTPYITHSKDMEKLYSTILYKRAWEGTKAYGYTLDERYIPIVGAKHADFVNSELKYKETYEKLKGHYLAGKEISEFPNVVHCLDFQKMRSLLNYRRHYEDTKANVHIPQDMMNHVLAKRCQYILSDLEYRHYFHQWTSLPEEPNVVRVRHAQEILSDNVYKDDLNWLKGIGCYVWDTPQILHAKKSYDLQSQILYTAGGKENLKNYNLVTDTPLYVTALQSGINASEVKYKENYHQIKDKYTTVLETVDYDRTRNLKDLFSSNLYKEAWDKVKATSYILPPNTVSLTHAKDQKHMASYVKYREEYEKFKALYTLPRSVEDDPNTARCLRVGKFNIDRLYRSVYEKNKMNIHIVPDMVEMVTAKDSQKKVSEIDYRLHLHDWICHPDLQVNSHVRKVTDQISDIVYKDDLTWLKGIGCYVWDTPEILHAKHAYDLRDDIKYKAHMLKTRNNYKLVTDTPVYVQAVKSGKQLSDAVYHYDYVHSIRGRVAPTTKTVDLDRALHAYKLQSENLYRKAGLHALPTGYRLPVDTPHFKHTKDTRYMSSYFKYKEVYEHMKAYGYTLGPNDVPFVNVRRVNNITSERLYRQLYHKLKDKIHTTPDTPEIRQVKKTQEAVSELIYKSDFFRMQGHMISLPYTPQVLHCRYVGDITSDIKYKEDLQILRGLGCFLYDTPDMVRSRHLRKLWSHYLYTDKARKMRDKYQVVLDTPEYRTVQELKTHLSELVYRASGRKQKSIFTSVPDTPDLIRAKRGQKLQSQYLYVELATKERPHHHAGNQTTALKHARHVKDMVSENKYKIQYEKMKDKYTPVPDTPILIRAKRAYWNASDLRYKETFHKTKGKYHTVKDALDIVYHRTVTDHISKIKYKENYMSQLGIWRSIPDRPEHFHHRAVTDAVSDVKYKADLTWLKGIGCYAYDTPDFTLAEKNKTLYSKYKYKEVFERTKSNFKYVADCPINRHFKFATQLMNEKKYRADYEQRKDKYHLVVDEPRHLLAKIAGDQISQIKYRKNYEKTKDKFTSIVDTPEHLRTTKVNKQISDILYKLEYNKAKPRGYTTIHDTPMLLHVRKVKDEVSDLKYKEVYQRTKSNCTIEPDAVHIKAAKDAYKVNTNLDYKKQYEATKAYWKWTPDRPDFIQAAKSTLQQSDFEYKLDREYLKGCKLSVTDDKDMVLALKNSIIESDLKYKEKHVKERGSCHAVPDTPQILLAKTVSSLVSENKYKQYVKKHLAQGSYTTLPETRDTIHVKEVTKNVSDTNYKKKFVKEKGKSNYSIMLEPPDVKHAMDVAKKQSNVAYKKDAKENLHYTTVADRPDIKKATQAAKQASEVEYRAKHRKEGSHGLSMLGRPDIEMAKKAAKLSSQVEYIKGQRRGHGHGAASYDTPMMRQLKKTNVLISDVKYRENFNKEKGKTPKYNPKDSQLYKVMKDANTLASEVKYKADLKKLHKPVTDMKESLIMNHVLNTSHLASSYQYKKNYEKSKGHYHTIPDNLEQLHLKEATELQSIVKYKEKYEKERGKPMLDFETPTYITAKESQQMQSGKEYRRDYEESIKGRNLTGLEVTPALLHVKYATKIASEKEYRKDLEESIRGKGLSEMEDTPDMLRAKNATQILNEKEYKRDLELEVKGRGLNAMANETPDFLRARNATDIASLIKYKQSAEMEKANFTSVVDTPEIIHAQQVKNLSSQKKYKEDAEKCMSYYETVLDTPEMQRVRENQKNFSLLQYQYDLKNSKGKITVVQDTPEILRVKENQKNFSSVLYKEDVSPGTAIGKTPEMMRVKQTQDHISSVKYKEVIGQGTPIPDLPEVKRVKQTQKHISSVMYKENLGTGIPTPVTPEIERVKRNQENFSSVLYKENLGKGTPTPITPEMERVKRNQENFSSILYKENLSKGTPLPVTPEMERVKRNQENFSSVLYKENIGKGIPIPITPEMERVKHNQENFSSVLYKENLGTGIPVSTTPEMQRVKLNQENLSSVLYKENMGKGTPLPVTPEMERIKHNQENISSVLYKENVGKGTPTPVTPEMQRVKRNQENISSVLYKENLGKATPTPFTPEMERVKRNQENFSSVLYRENMRKATPTPVTPEMERAKRNQENISSVLYSDSFRKQIQGKAAYVLDTPEMRRVRETQRHISTVKYHEDFEKHKGCFTPVVTDPITERVKKNMQDFSDISYRGIQRKVVEMEQKRNDQDQETITGLRVWRTNPGSVFDYDPAEDNIQSRSLHMINAQAQRRSREQSRSASGLSISGGEEKSEHSEAAHLSTYSDGGVFFSAASTGYKHARTTELPQQRSSSVATQQTTVSSIPSHPSTAGKIFRAMYDYMAADADEVSFKDGDAIVNVQAIDEGWMYGTVQRTGRTGMLPANYVEAI